MRKLVCSDCSARKTKKPPTRTLAQFFSSYRTIPMSRAICRFLQTGIERSVTANAIGSVCSHLNIVYRCTSAPTVRQTSHVAAEQTHVNAIILRRYVCTRTQHFIVHCLCFVGINMPTTAQFSVQCAFELSNRRVLVNNNRTTLRHEQYMSFRRLERKIIIFARISSA